MQLALCSAGSSVPVYLLAPLRQEQVHWDATGRPTSHTPDTGAVWNLSRDPIRLVILLSTTAASRWQASHSLCLNGRMNSFTHTDIRFSQWCHTIICTHLAKSATDVSEVNVSNWAVWRHKTHSVVGCNNTAIFWQRTAVHTGKHKCFIVLITMKLDRPKAQSAAWQCNNSEIVWIQTL